MPRNAMQCNAKQCSETRNSPRYANAMTRKKN
jgi:hypothetical protein